MFDLQLVLDEMVLQLDLPVEVLLRGLIRLLHEQGQLISGMNSA